MLFPSMSLKHLKPQSRTLNPHYPLYFSALSRTVLLDNLSRSSCIHNVHELRTSRVTNLPHTTRLQILADRRTYQSRDHTVCLSYTNICSHSFFQKCLQDSLAKCTKKSKVLPKCFLPFGRRK